MGWNFDIGKFSTDASLEAELVVGVVLLLHLQVEECQEIKFFWVWRSP
jgi:hypothetical protein